MKTLSIGISVCFACALISGGLMAKGKKATAPIEEARAQLEKAHNLIVKKEEGASGKGKKKATIPNIVVALSSAETHLTEAKNNKGSNSPVALDLIASAKVELEAARDEKGEEHLS